jgi:hypothetical protein
MSDAWYAAFGLLTIITLLTAVLLVAVLRQVGEIHQVLAERGPSRRPSPLRDRLVEMPLLRSVAGDGPSQIFHGDAMTVMTYVSAGCGACDLVPSLIREARADAPADVTFALITDGDRERAGAFAERHEVDVPFVHNPGIAGYLGISGSPFAIAARREGPNLRLVAGAVIQDAADFAELVAFAASSPDEPAANARTEEEPRLDIITYNAPHARLGVSDASME